MVRITSVLARRVFKLLVRIENAGYQRPLTRIRLIAEYPQNSTEVLWVNQKPEGVYTSWHIPGGIYAGQRIPGFDGHFSYHRDGEFHFRFKGQTIRYPRRPA